MVHIDLVMILDESIQTEKEWNKFYMVFMAKIKDYIEILRYPEKYFSEDGFTDKYDYSVPIDILEKSEGDSFELKISMEYGFVYDPSQRGKFAHGSIGSEIEPQFMIILDAILTEIGFNTRYEELLFKAERNILLYFQKEYIITREVDEIIVLGFGDIDRKIKFIQNFQDFQDWKAFV